MPLRLVFSLVVLSSICLPSLAQTWTYHGNSSCFRNGDKVQCFDNGTMQGYATNQQQFESAYQNGEAIGEGLGLLIRAWMERHRQVEIERHDVREEIAEHYRATFDLNDEITTDLKNDVDALRRLSKLDPPRSDLFNRAEDSTNALISQLAQMRSHTEKNLPGILAAKDLKYLNSNLELAQKFHSQANDAAKRQFVYCNLLFGYLGFLESQRSSTPSIEGPLAELTAKAQNGNAAAQLELGRMYRDGTGVSENPAVAAKWLEAAAQSGQGEAQLAIGELYEAGKGVVQDYIRAHVWYNLAASVGTPEAVAHRNSLSLRMTPEQISEAQKLATQWHPGSAENRMQKILNATAIGLNETSAAPGQVSPSLSGADSTATVVSSKVVTESTGTTVRRNPACNNPQGSFMRGFCATGGTEVRHNSISYAQVVAVIGDKSYTLEGRKLPPPGSYNFRFLDTDQIELSWKAANGKPDKGKFRVVAIDMVK
jgi:hypothetical protein